MATHELHQNTSTPKQDSLNSSDRSIRPIQIQPGNEEDTVQCNITQKQQIAKTHFYLSYKRGNGSRSRSILINGVPTVVSEDLWFFLHTARRYRFNDLVYIDDICINQQNLVERNQQAILLHEIISQAKATIVWLGMTDSQASTLASVDSARNTSTYIQNRFRSWIEMGPPYEDPLPSGSTAVSAKLNYSLLERAEAKRKQTWQGMIDAMDLVQNSLYWCQVQTVPEIILARNVQMLHPTGTIDLRWIFGYTSWADTKHGFRKHNIGSKGDIRILLNPQVNLLDFQDCWSETPKSKLYQYDIKPRKPVSIEQLLSFARSRTCTDKRDRVFSAFAASDHAAFMTFGYDSNDYEILIEAVRAVTKAREARPVTLAKLIVEVGQVIGLTAQCLEMEPGGPSSGAVGKHFDNLDASEGDENAVAWVTCRQDEALSLAIRFKYAGSSYIIQADVIDAKTQAYVGDEMTLSDDAVDFPLLHRCCGQQGYWGREVELFNNGVVDESAVELPCRCMNLWRFM